MDAIVTASCEVSNRKILLFYYTSTTEVNDTGLLEDDVLSLSRDQTYGKRTPFCSTDGEEECIEKDEAQ